MRCYDPRWSIASSTASSTATTAIHTCELNPSSSPPIPSTEILTECTNPGSRFWCRKYSVCFCGAPSAFPLATTHSNRSGAHLDVIPPFAVILFNPNA